MFVCMCVVCVCVCVFEFVSVRVCVYLCVCVYDGGPVEAGEGEGNHKDTEQRGPSQGRSQFTCFTSTKVQILTRLRRRALAGLLQHIEEEYTAHPPAPSERDTPPTSTHRDSSARTAVRFHFLSPLAITLDIAGGIGFTADHMHIFTRTRMKKTYSCAHTTLEVSVLLPITWPTVSSSRCCPNGCAAGFFFCVFCYSYHTEYRRRYRYCCRYLLRYPV
jgi:hypothetical protein